MALQCCYCGGIWKPKVKSPRACPICKRYFDSINYPIQVPDDQLPEQKRISNVRSTDLEEGYFIQCEKCKAEVDRVFRFEKQLLCRNCLLAEIDQEVV